jgi:hypothetical protein
MTAKRLISSAVLFCFFPSATRLISLQVKRLAAGMCLQGVSAPNAEETEDTAVWQSIYQENAFLFWGPAK